MNTFAQRLVCAMERLGSTKAARARAIGITPRHFVEWEDGRIPQILIRLAEQGVIEIIDTAPPTAPALPPDDGDADDDVEPVNAFADAPPVRGVMQDLLDATPTRIGVNSWTR